MNLLNDWLEFSSSMDDAIELYGIFYKPEENQVIPIRRYRNNPHTI